MSSAVTLYFPKYYFCETDIGCPVGMDNWKCYTYKTKTFCTAKYKTEVLTYQMRLFAESLCNGMKPKEAYIKAFSMTDSEIQKNTAQKAKTMLAQPLVGEILRKANQSAVESCSITKQQHLNDLLRIRDMALQDGAWGAAITAEKARGECSGLYVQKIESNNHIAINVNPSDLGVL